MRPLFYNIKIFLPLFILLSISIFANSNTVNTSTISVEAFPNNAPLSFINKKGQPDGFVIDLTNAIMKELNDSCTFNFIKPDYDILKSENQDSTTVYVIIHSEERAAKYHFSSSFSNLYYDIVLREGQSYSDFYDLAGKRIIVKENAISRDILESLGPDYSDNLIFVPDMEVGLKMLSGGEGDVALCGNSNAVTIINEEGLSNLVTYESGLPVQELCYASKDYRTIMGFNKAINSLIRSGEYDKIYYKWYGSKENEYTKYVVGLLLLLALVALILAAVWWYLRTKIKIATKELTEYNKQVIDLNQLINMFIGESEITIFIYDVIKNELHLLADGRIVESPYRLNEIETFIHVDDRGKYDKCWEDILKGVRKKVVSSFRVYDRVSGKYCDYEYVITGQKNDEGKVSRIIYSRRDESKQRQLLRKQDETILNLDLALYSAKLVRWQYDIINDVHRIVDYNSNKYILSDQQWLDLIAPEDHAAYLQFIETILQDSENADFVTIHVKLPEDTEYKFYELTAVCRYNKNGELLSLHGIMNDVSTLNNYQSQLNEKVEVLNAINNHIPVGIVFLDKEGIVREVNNYMLKILGLNTRHGIVHKYNYWQNHHVQRIKRESVDNGEILRYKIKYEELPDVIKNQGDDSLAHGEYFDASISGVYNLSDELIGYILLHTDITESYLYQNKIEALQNNISLALEAGDLVLWVYDSVEQEFDILEEGVLNEGKISKDEYNSLIYSDDRNIFWNAIDKLVIGELSKDFIKYRVMISGEQRWYQCSLMATSDDNGAIKITGIRKDITDEIRTKESIDQKHLEIQKSEERLNLILNKLPIPVYIIDPHTKIVVYINDAALKLFGTGNYLEVKNFVKEEDVEHHALKDSYVLETGEEYIANEMLRLKNGNEFNTYVRKSLVEFNGQKQILVMRMDLTDQRKAQMTNKILSFSLPSLKAYTWFIDSRDNILNYGEISTDAERNLLEYKTMDAFNAIVHKDDKEGYANAFNEFIQQDFGESAFCYRIDLEHIGQYEWWESRAVVETINNENGESYKFIYGIDININERKQSELSLIENRAKLAKLNKQNELILNNTRSGIVYLSNNFEVQWSNVDLVFGDIAKGLYQSGQYCYTLLNQKSPCKKCPVHAAVNDGAISYNQFKYADRIFGSTAIPVENNGTIEGIVLRIDDITERVQLINDLKKAKHKAEESEKIKMAFLANMSHEIRTPLNAIVGFSEMIQYADGDDERNEYLHIINNNNELLLRLIGDVLDLSKIESGSLDIKKEKVDVVEMMNEMFVTMKTRCSNPNIEMLNDIRLKRCTALIDRDRFAQIGINFLSNAIKYTKSGEIILRLDYIDNGLYIAVQDTGIGIDVDKQDLIFQRFEKLDTFAQGTGLGLAICKAIIDAIGGKIGFDSIKDVGSTFWAWIPCEADVEFVSAEAGVEILNSENNEKEEAALLAESIEIVIEPLDELPIIDEEGEVNSIVFDKEEGVEQKPLDDKEESNNLTVENKIDVENETFLTEIITFEEERKSIEVSIPDKDADVVEEKVSKPVKRKSQTKTSKKAPQAQQLGLLFDDFE